MKRLLVVLCLFLQAFSGLGQVLHSASMEVVGSPGWYRAISVGKDGVVMLVKEDQTRFKVVKFNAQLGKQWDQDLFMDTEKGPAAVHISPSRLALLFSETSGMYYQLLDFDLDKGEYQRRGFEIREFFQDKGMVVYPDKVLLVGINNQGLAYYVYNYITDMGRLIQTDLKGTYEIQEVREEPAGALNVLVVEKTMGYTNESKKKGPYVRSSKIAEIRLDTSGRELGRREVVPHEGRFPISAVRTGDHVSGVYQQPDGEKGMYYAAFVEAKNRPVFYRGLPELLGDLMVGKEKARFLNSAQWMVLPPAVSGEEVLVGGVFYTPQFQQLNVQRVAGARGMYRSVFAGIAFTHARVFALNGGQEVTGDYPIAVNHRAADPIFPLSINTAGAIAYSARGKVLVRNFQIGTRPIAYQLTEDEGEASPHVAGYRQTLHWYDNVFLAIGTQSRVEAHQLPTSTKKKKKKRSVPYTQTRKTFFLTSISAGKSE